MDCRHLDPGSIPYSCGSLGSLGSRGSLRRGHITIVLLTVGTSARLAFGFVDRLQHRRGHTRHHRVAHRRNQRIGRRILDHHRILGLQDRIRVGLDQNCKSHDSLILKSDHLLVFFNRFFAAIQVQFVFFIVLKV